MNPSKNFNQDDIDILKIIKSNKFEICSNVNGEIVINGFNTHLYSLEEIRKDVYRVNVKFNDNFISDIKILLVSGVGSEVNDSVKTLIGSYTRIFLSIQEDEVNDMIASLEIEKLDLSITEHCRIISSRSNDLETFITSDFTYSYVSEKSSILENDNYILFSI